MKKIILLPLLLLSSFTIIQTADADNIGKSLREREAQATSDTNPHRTAAAIAEDDAWVREQLTPRLLLVSKPFPLPREGSYDDSKEYQYSEEGTDEIFVRKIKFNRGKMCFYSLSLYAGVIKKGNTVTPPGCSHDEQTSPFPNLWNHYSSRDNKQPICNDCSTILKSLEKRDREESKTGEV